MKKVDEISRNCRIYTSIHLDLDAFGDRVTEIAVQTCDFQWLQTFNPRASVPGLVIFEQIMTEHMKLLLAADLLLMDNYLQRHMSLELQGSYFRLSSKSVV